MSSIGKLIVVLMGAGLAALAGFLVLAFFSEAPPRDAFAKSHFKITVTRGTSIEHEDFQGFDYYKLAWGARGHLIICEACPDRHDIGGDPPPADLQISELTLNGFKAHQELLRRGGTVDRMLDIRLPVVSGKGFIVITTSYSHLGADDARIADQMISTIAPK